METLKPPHPKSPEMQAYFLALGEFIDKFTQVENSLIGLVIVLARIGNAKILNTLARDVRVNAAMPMIARLLEIHGIEGDIAVRYRNLQAQLAIINGARNEIVHGGLSYGADGTTEVKRLLPALAGIPNSRRPMSTESVRDMAADLETIHREFMELFIRVAVALGHQGSVDPMGPPPTWRYRSPRQAPKAGTRRDRRQRQPPPPSASQA